MNSETWISDAMDSNTWIFKVSGWSQGVLLILVNVKHMSRSDE